MKICDMAVIFSRECVNEIDILKYNADGDISWEITALLKSKWWYFNELKSYVTINKAHGKTW